LRGGALEKTRWKGDEGLSTSKTFAFILKTQDYRETSLLVDFFTRDFGKVKGILKGIRDSRGRFGTTLEPFSLNEILFYRRKRGGDLHLVTQAELVDLYDGVRQDLERLGYASYFVELLNEFAEPEDPSPELFDLMKDSLLFLASGASPRRAARIFETKLLDLSGLMPEIRACVSCGASAPSPSFFNASLGGVQCRECMEKNRPEGGFPISKGAVNFLDHVRRSPVSELYPVKVSQEVGAEVEKTLRRFVDFHLSRKLKTVIFLEKMGYN